MWSAACLFSAILYFKYNLVFLILCKCKRISILAPLLHCWLCHSCNSCSNLPNSIKIIFIQSSAALSLTSIQNVLVCKNVLVQKAFYDRWISPIIKSLLYTLIHWHVFCRGKCFPSWGRGAVLLGSSTRTGTARSRQLLTTCFASSTLDIVTMPVSNTFTLSCTLVLNILMAVMVTTTKILWLMVSSVIAFVLWKWSAVYLLEFYLPWCDDSPGVVWCLFPRCSPRGL